MNSQHCHHNHRLTRLPLMSIWLILSGLFIALHLSERVQAAPRLLQTLPPQFINEQGAPLVHAPLRLLCYVESSGHFTLTHDLRDTTSAQGQLNHQLPLDCPRLAAMQEIYQQPSGKSGRGAAYTVYHTSWSAGNATPAPANGPIVVRSDQSLVLFDVAVALEWEPPVDSPYLHELEEGLRLASAYLYDVTDGQMAFGSWHITTAGQGWESADLRIRAANDYRPSAQVGGMVAAATSYTSTTGNNTLYTPGAIVWGRYWDGAHAADPIQGAWNQPAAYRTLIHEWLHYALFLYDEYQDSTGNGRSEAYCSCPDLPQVGQNPAVCGQVSADLAASVMGYHYTASELWLDGSDVSCQRSEQFRVHGSSDWETLARWGTIQGLSTNWLRKPSSELAGPSLGNLAGLAGSAPVAASDQRIFLPWLASWAATKNLPATPPMPVVSAALQSATNITVNVSINASLPLTDLLALQVQIYTWEPATASQPVRVIYQGTSTGARQTPNRLGQAMLVGVKPGTQVALYVIQPGVNHYAYYGTLDPALGQQTLQAAIDPTTLNLAVTPLFDGTRISAYNLTLHSGAALTTPPTAQLCAPDAATSCAQNSGWRQNMINSGAGMTWTTTLTAPPTQPFPGLGILQIETSSGLLLRWYDTLGGVGPGRIRSYAPRRDGLITVDSAAGFPDGPNLVFMMPTANSAALQAALPPGVSGAMGSPFDVQVLLPSTASGQVAAASSPPSDAPGATPVVVSMFYDQATVERLNLKPNQSQLLQYQASTGRWQLITPSGRSAALSWVASQPLNEMGVVAVARMSSPDFGLKPEMYALAGKPPNFNPIQVQIVMPAASTVLTSSAFVRSAVPLEVDQVDNIQCNQGNCYYDPATHQVLWQGQVAKDDLLILTFDLLLDNTIPPGQQPKSLALQATAFDGATEHALAVDVSLRGPKLDDTDSASTEVPTDDPNLKERLPPAPASIGCTTDPFESSPQRLSEQVVTC